MHVFIFSRIRRNGWVGWVDGWVVLFGLFFKNPKVQTMAEVTGMV